MGASESGLFSFQQFTDAGITLVGGRVYTYVQGTTTPKTAYTEPTGTTAQTYTSDGVGGQYIALNARGEMPAPLYLGSGSYDISLKRADGSTVWTRRADPTSDVVLPFAASLAADAGAGLSGWSALLSYIANSVGGKLNQLLHIKDFGGADNGFTDDSSAEAAGMLKATAQRGMFVSNWMSKFPGRGLKVWKPTFGTKDQAAAVSIVAGSDAEPVTQVLGFTTDSDVSVYPDRDSVALFIENQAQPTIVETTLTTFTATTVTSVAIADAVLAKKIKRGMLIDTNETPKKTGVIQGASGSTLTVSGWYIVDGSRNTATPANGTKIFVNPSTKVWAINANVYLPAGAHATQTAGCELGLINEQAANQGYLYDAVNLGTYKGMYGYQSRGLTAGWTGGFFAQGNHDFGFISRANGTGVLSDGDTVGVLAAGSVNALVAKNASGFAFVVQDITNAFLSGIDGTGRVQRGKLYTHNPPYVNGDTVNAFDTLAIASATSGAATVNLPDPVGDATRHIYLKNAMASTSSVKFAGASESGGTGFTVAPGRGVHVYSDGVVWISIPAD